MQEQGVHESTPGHVGERGSTSRPRSRYPRSRACSLAPPAPHSPATALHHHAPNKHGELYGILKQGEAYLLPT